MKKIFTFWILMLASLYSLAQTTFSRTSLYEEFTSENFGIWYPTEPLLNTLFLTNPNPKLVIPIKWAVPIPSVPSNTWSLYQTNKAEINWRCKSSSGNTLAAGPSTLAYGYTSQNTSTDVVTNGINSGFTGRFDGQHQWVFGAASDDPSSVNNAVILSAQSQTTNFSIVMTPSWSPTFTNCVVTVTIESSSSFTAIGALMFRLCLVERVINFATPPGINGEKVFNDVVRKSYPTTIVSGSVTSMGTPLNSNWVTAQTQTFTINCNIPNYIQDLSQMAFVGFVQDDGDRKIYQAARTPEAAIPNDIKADSLYIPLSCNGVITPSFMVQNLGLVGITALTITPYIDGIAQTIINYTGNIAGGANATIALPNYTASYGSHTFSATITGVSGGDINAINNTTKAKFGVSNLTSSGITEHFATFPPANWYVLNYDFEPATWGLGTTGGFGTSATCAKYDFWNILGWGGEFDDLVFPALNLLGNIYIVLTFDVAYAQYTNQNDKLEVMVSTDCGATWQNVYSKQGANLSTAPSHSTSPFVPSLTQWRTETVNLPSLANQPNAILKFVATSDFGNNLYIDNVNIAQPSLIKKSNSTIISCELFPNPTSDLTTLSINLSENEIIGITIINSIGQTMYFSKNTSFYGGVNNISLNTEDWMQGVYFVNISTPKGLVNKKLSVIK